ncbi:MAG TPA: amidohydrolase/deacetylase family metallohydrolase [Chloroflexota bacterium]|jgi:dihydroorotase|nr:amidohydrolase/deacetylase family metallohydrolase [Chloroflexota bacterium]
MPELDLVLVGGTVVDPDGDATYRADVGVADGKIAAVERQPGKLRGTRSVDCSGRLVTPGLVDSHVHVYNHVSPGSLDPDDVGVRQGVCAVVDAGSFGPNNARGFSEYVVKTAETKVFGLCNISRNGNSTDPGEGEVLGFLKPEATARTVEQHRDWVVGVKARASATAAGLLGATSVRLAKVAAREAGVRLMVHVGNGPPTLEEVCEVLTAGDLITHCFHGKIGGSVTRQGEMLPAVVAAVERGVLLDVGHGSASFAWATAERAVQLGYRPHVISTDLHRGCVNGPTYSLVKTMSKFLHLGMSLVEVVRAASPSPARALGIGERFGKVEVGFPANLSVLELVDRTELMWDVERHSREVGGVLEARYALVEGKLHEALSDATAPERQPVTA